MSKCVFKPFVDFDEDVAKRYGFEIKQVIAQKLPNGFISIYVSWSTKKSEYKFKYPTNTGAMYGWSDVSYDLSFPQVKYKINNEVDFYSNFRVEVGLIHRKDKQIRYRPLFHQNTKYSAIVWFAPRGWNDTENSKEIFHYSVKE